MQSHPIAMSRARGVLGNVLAIFPAAILIASSLAKLGHVPAVAGPLAKLGFFGDRLLFIAVAELVSAVLFVVPRTRALGLMLVSSYLGGAIAAHMSHGEAIFQPAFILALFWTATAVRNPEAFWSLAHERSANFTAINAEQR